MRNTSVLGGMQQHRIRLQTEHIVSGKNVVNVLKLVTKDTIEEKIIHLQGKKAKLAEDIIEGKETAEHYLIREEIIDLLSEKDK